MIILRQALGGSVILDKDNVAWPDRLLLELNLIGVNLNQIARALNSDRPEQGDLAVTLAEFRAVLAKVRAP